MEKHEQSFEFTELHDTAPGEKGNGDEPRTPAGKTVAGRVVTPLGKAGAHKLNSSSAKRDNAAETAVNGKSRPVALGKMVKAGSTVKPVKAKAVAHKVDDGIADSKGEPVPVVVKAVQVAKSIDNADLDAVHTANSEKSKSGGDKKSSTAAESGTGPTRKLPIPMGKQGVQLTEENIAHRSGQADRVDDKPTVKPNSNGAADTEPTQKIEMPPPDEQPEFIETAAAEAEPTADDSPAVGDSPVPTAEAVVEHKSLSGKASKPVTDMIRFGSKLRDARLAKGLSLADIEEHTKIRKIYIEALEEENFDRLPPMVYVCAYVKTLANLYGMEAAVRDEVVGGLRELLPTHLSDATIQNMHIDCELDEEEEHRLKLIITIGSIVFVLVAIVLSVIFWLSSGDDMSDKKIVTIDGDQPFNRQELDKLSPPQSLKMSLLPPPLGGKGRK